MFQTKLQWTLPNSKISLSTASALSLLSGVGIYYGLQIIGLDPEFSVPLAMAYCQERSWVHLDTTPFYSLMRSTGALLGMGAVVLLVGDRLMKAERQWRSRRVGMNILGLMLSLVVIILLHSKYIPSFVENGEVVFYSVAVFKVGLIPCVTLLPCLF